MLSAGRSCASETAWIEGRRENNNRARRRETNRFHPMFLRMRWLILTWSSERPQVHRLYKGGTRAQKPNPQAHIQPANFILSSITDNMLLVTQKKERSGILLPVHAYARDLYQQLYMHPQHRMSLFHLHPSLWGIRYRTGPFMRQQWCRQGRRDWWRLIFSQAEKLWWFNSAAASACAASHAGLGRLDPLEQLGSPLALALLTSGSDRLHDSSTVHRHKSHAASQGTVTQWQTHALTSPPTKPQVSGSDAALIPLGCMLVHVSRQRQHI